MNILIQGKKSVKCTVINRRLLRILAAAQLGLAGALALFSTVIDPPALINALIAAVVIVVEGSSVGIALNYLRHGCFG
ncbi:MAG: hypothetical protein ACP5GY_05120 [Vulcanisaeta sp.]